MSSLGTLEARALTYMIRNECLLVKTYNAEGKHQYSFDDGGDCDMTDDYFNHLKSDGYIADVGVSYGPGDMFLREAYTPTDKARVYLS